MARPHKKSNTKLAVDPQARHRLVQQLIEKGKIKEAFKEAKFFFHHEASPENHRLVESTYILRVQSLIREGMTSAAREVATSMMEFGVNDPELKRALALLLPELGLSDKAMAFQEALQSPELKAQLVLKMADRAILHPEEKLADLPELCNAVAAVRSALASLDSGNDSQALDLLQSIPRNSPMADWRYFVRGLVAFRQDDVDQAKANWERLDPQRAAKKIAQALLPGSTSQPPDTQTHLKSLEIYTFGEPVLGRISDLKHALEASDLSRALQLIGPLRKSLERIDTRFATRLTAIVLSPLSEEIKRCDFDEAKRLIKDFLAVLAPLPWDPQWNRFQAILWEGEQGDPKEAIFYWQGYLKDLDQRVAIPQEELRRSKALVWRRIGEIYTDLEDADEVDGFRGFSLNLTRAVNNDHTRAEGAFQQSLQLDPTQHKTHQALIDSYEKRGDHKSSIAAIEGLLAAFPDDVGALQRLISLYMSQDNPEPLLDYIAHLRKLRPLDTRLDGDEAAGRFMLARHLALKGLWEEGRTELDRAVALLKDEADAYRQLSRRAALEFKAGDLAKAEEYINRAKATLKEPTVLWLAMEIEATRYKLGEVLAQQYKQDLHRSLGRKATSETAGLLARLMYGFFAVEIDYEGRREHTQAVLGYLQRTKRLKYREPDLRKVCDMLERVRLDERLLSAFLGKGKKSFPKSPYFLFRSAQEDLKRGPFSCDPRAVENTLEKALALAEASSDPEDSEFVPAIKDMLARLRTLGDAMATLPFGQGRMPGSPEELLEMLNGMFDDDDDDDSDLEGDETPPNYQRRPPKRKPR